MVESKNGTDDAKSPIIDLEALELQIDREVDSLFEPAKPSKAPEIVLTEIPATPAERARAERDAPAPVPEVRLVELPETPPKAPIPPSGLVLQNEEGAPAPISSGSAGERGFDAKALQSEIDKEIDSVFAPFQKTPAAPPQGLSPREPASAGTESPAIGEAPPVEAIELVSETPAGPALSETAAVASLAAARPEMPSELPRLIEAFNAAYLSLDWDFSPEHLYALELALSELEPHAMKTTGAEPVFKLLKAFLPRLRARPQAASPQLVELIRDSQGLLAHMLLLEGPIGAQEKERLRDLLARFRSMKEKAAAAKEARDEAAPPKSERAAAVAAARAEIFAESAEAASVEEKLPDRWSLRELNGWLTTSGEAIAQAVAGLEAEMVRIRQVEEILSKSQALAPIVSRLAAVRKKAGEALAGLKGKGAECTERSEWLANLETVAATAAPEPAKEAAPVPRRPPAQAKTIRNDIYVFTFAGKTFGVLAGNVVKVRAVSPGKVKKLLDRGYATLADFKPLFKSIKSGVLGEWKEIGGDALKARRFTPVRPWVFDVAEMPAAPGGAVFLGTVTESGIVFTDSAKVERVRDAEVVLEPSSGFASIGTVALESGLSALVLDINRILEEAKRSE